MPRKRSSKGLFVPKSPEKYTGEYPIVFRSTWELEFMRYCDQHPDVIEWSSEPNKIPYPNPLNGKQSIYVPDFMVTYLQKGGKKSTKLIEIKPLHEASESHARNSMDVAIRTKNEAKWGAATQWAKRRGIDFLVLTEAELYANHANRKGREHSIKARGREQIKAPNAKKPQKPKGSPAHSTQLSKNAKISNMRSPKVGKVRRASRANKI